MNKKAFTLLEILLVVAAIAILAGIVIVAINPGRQLAQVRNAARKSDVSTILNAIYQYSLDNDGLFPASIDTNLRMLGTSGSGCNVSCGVGGGGGGGAVTITDNSQSTFAGTYTNTVYNTNNSLLNLSANQTSGTYTSDIKDATASATWSTLAWTPNRPTNKALPNSAATETGYPTGNANMTGNIVLMHMDESSGATSFADSSGSNNGGMCSGNGCPTATTGKFGGAMNFDGTSDNIIINKTFGGTAQTSLEAWINVAGATSDMQAVISPTISTFVHFQLFTGGNIIVYTNTGNAVLPIVSLTPFNTWRHVVISAQSGSTNLYVNGVLIGSSNLAFSTVNSTSNLHIGNGYNSGRFFKGAIDEVAIYNRALSATEAMDHYKRGLLSLKYQARSCANANCSDGTFAGPDGTANTYYSEASNNTNSTPSLSLTNISNNRYFQYKAFLDTADSALTPELKNAIISGSTAGGGGNASSTASSCLDLSSNLAPTYITSIPFDPNTGSSNQTYYAVQKTSGGRINVQACSAENSEAISITR